jgi:hypothetical protein
MSTTSRRGGLWVVKLYLPTCTLEEGYYRLEVRPPTSYGHLRVHLACHKSTGTGLFHEQEARGVGRYSMKFNKMWR